MKTKFAETTTLPLPNGPHVPGLGLRRFRGEEDYEVVASIVQQTFLADGLHTFFTAEDARWFFEHPMNFDPGQDTWFVQVGSETVGYFEASWRVEGQDRRIYFHDGFLLPPWRRRGIGRAMLDVAETRLLEVAANHPDDGPQVYRAWADDRQAGKVALLEKQGYAPARYYFEMVNSSLDDLPEVTTPDDLEIRPAKPKDFHLAWQVLDEAFLEPWGLSPYAEERYRRCIQDRRFQPNLWIIAWEGNQVAGTIINHIDKAENQLCNRKRGYMQKVYVRRPWRGRGLARALLARSLRLLRDFGMQEAALNLETEDPDAALRLYLDLGFKPSRNVMVFEKSLLAS